MCTKEYLFLLITTLLLPSCVSVKLAGPQFQRSQSAHLTSPLEPFVSVQIQGSEQAWKSRRTGQVITYYSECTTGYDPALSDLQSEILVGFTGLKIEDSKTIEFQSRKALRTRAIAQVEGVNTKLDLVVLKKSGCIYHFSYLGTPDSFAKELPVFEAFLSSVRVE